LPLPLPGKERDEAEKKGVASHAGGNPAEAGVDQGDRCLGHECEGYWARCLRSNVRRLDEARFTAVVLCRRYEEDDKARAISSGATVVRTATVHVSKAAKPRPKKKK
jgi:hypothetical protein